MTGKTAGAGRSACCAYRHVVVVPSENIGKIGTMGTMAGKAHDDICSRVNSDNNVIKDGCPGNRGLDTVLIKVVRVI
jgi:hypothetical protein